MTQKEGGSRSRVLATSATLLFVVAFSAGRATPVSAQSYRGWLSSSLHLVELRPVGLDSVSRTEVVEDADGRLLFGGYEVSCADELCTGLLPQSKERTIAATQDASFTYWGLGVQGLSATGLIRLRTSFGGDASWPRYDDEFDAMLAYAQFVRGSWQVRAGRQELRSGLGFAGYDGVSGAFDRRNFRLELYGGRSLARGLRQPANEALRSLDDFFVDQGVYLIGGGATYRNLGFTVTGRYHREILADRSGLDSERASLDFSVAIPGARIRGGADYDFAFQRVGKAEVTVSAPFDDARWLVEVGGRRYIPYFQLSTIWGFFEPVSYSEARVRVAWSGTRSLGAWVSGSYRSYGDTETSIIGSPLKDDGWRAEGGARWEPTERWSINGRYQFEWVPGALLNSGDVAVRLQLLDALGVALTFASFQQIEEYRLGQGRALGLGGTVDYGITDRLDVFGGFSYMRHRDGGTVYTSPWNQTRAWTSLRWTVGRDPGLANRRIRR